MQHQPGKIEHCLCLYSSYTQNCAQITVLDLNKFEIWVHRSLRKELNEHLRCLYWSLASEAFLIEWEDYLVAQSFRDVTENINDNHLFYFIFFWFINSIWDFFSTLDAFPSPNLYFASTKNIQLGSEANGGRWPHVHRCFPLWT